MTWKFWQKKSSDHTVILAKPKDLPSTIGRTLVVDKKYDPDWVWKLKIVTVPKENKKGVFDFRVFDPDTARAKGVSVLNFTTLDENEGFILFDGWYDKITSEVYLNDRYKSVKKDSAA